ncbi:hypothetical protein FRB93_013056 [Tulasnella sp. JGI-2019a]|nr:hypothetical protein FRB93_013056 [Tulasnella sp. JGI-2019a]
MPSLHSLSRPILLSLFFNILPRALAFSFSYTAPTQCGPLTVSWTGGIAPYYLLITPLFNVPLNLSIPSSAYSNGKGSYTTNLALANPEQFLLTMSDATGTGTGGTSGVLTVADPVNGATCDTTAPSLPFNFVTPTSLQQCRQYTINGYSSAIQPITVVGLIPLGSTFLLYPPVGSTSFNWTADVKSGTSIVLSLFDAQGRTGGATDLLTVGSSNDATCIDSSSPASTITSNPSSTGSSPSATDSNSSGDSNTGAIIGGSVAAAIVSLAIVGLLILFFMRKRRNKNDTPHISTQFGGKRQSLEPHMESGVLHEPSAVDNYEPVPFMLPPSSASGRTSDYGQYPPGSAHGDTEASGSVAGGGVAAVGSAGYNKRTEAYRGSRRSTENTPTRFIIHSDAGEVPDAQEDEEPETVELPPQYASINGKVVRSPTYREPGAGASSSRAEDSFAHVPGEEEHPLLPMASRHS